MVAYIIIGVLCFLFGVVVTAILMKVKNTALRRELEMTKQQAEKDADRQNEQFEYQLNMLRLEVEKMSDSIMKQRREELAKENEMQIGAILKPLRESIDGMNRTMIDSIRNNSENKASLEKAIENLMQKTVDIGNDANRLAKALKNDSKAQGNWGELMLDSVLESSGLKPGVHYDRQCLIRDDKGNTVFNEDNGKRMIPDVIVHFPDNKELIIDSKVSLTAYCDYCNAEDDERRRSYLQAHLTSIRKHVKELHDKNYSLYIKAPGESLDYVIMYLPNESALRLALDNDPDLWQEAFDKGVFITGTQSLMSVLRVIYIVWTQFVQNKNHQQVFEEVKTLLFRIDDFINRYEELGKRIDSLSKVYEEAGKKLYSGNKSVVNAADRIRSLGEK